MKKKTRKAALKIPKKGKDTSQGWLLLVVTIIVVSLFIVLIANYRGSVGQAISIGTAPLLGEPIDLAKHQSITFTVLPEEYRQVTFTAGLNPYDESPQTYTFNLTRRDSSTYAFMIKKDGALVAQDILELGSGADAAFIHLNNNDPIPDLEVSYGDQQVVVRSLHYLSADRADIQFFNASNQPYSAIIRLDPSESLLGRINATSTSPPQLAVNVGTLGEPASSREENRTSVSYSYTAPANSAAVLLDITAQVQAQDTHAYYTLAVGDMAYALQEEQFPKMTLRLVDGTRAILNITFLKTTELQPFALPCKLSNSSIDALFKSTAVKAVYAYDGPSKQPKVWSNGAPSELTDFAPFTGYFLKLAAEQDVTITTSCTVETVQSSAVPDVGAVSQAKLLLEGWNLISLPGIVPRPLTDFAPAGNFTTYQCGRNYACALDTAPLYPGKPYWVWTASNQLLRFSVR